MGGGSGKWEALLIINFWWNGPGGKWEGGSSIFFFRKLQGGKWEGGSANYYFQRERWGGEEEVSRLFPVQVKIGIDNDIIIISCTAVQLFQEFIILLKG